jgi:hypothetical protein
MSDYQLLPPLSAEEYAALKADIAARGVLVPVEVDEQGNLLDGHHRVLAWEELRAEGVPVAAYPATMRAGLSEADKLAHVLALNLARRHLDKEARRELVVRLRAARMSTWDIAEKTGIPQTTVRRDLDGTEPFGSVGTDARVIGRDGISRPALIVRAPHPDAPWNANGDSPYVPPDWELTRGEAAPRGHGVNSWLPPLAAPAEEQAVMVAIRAASITRFDPAATAAAIPFDVRASHRGAFVSLREWLDRVIAALDADGGIRALPKG